MNEPKAPTTPEPLHTEARDAASTETAGSEAQPSPTPTRPAAAAPAAGPVAAVSEEELEAGIVAAIQEVFDPEIPVNIYELGLIYDIDVQDGNHIAVKMTLTSPACPVAGTLPGEVRDKVLGVPGVSDAEVDVVWDPVWNPSMMSEAARLQLGML